MGNICFRTQDIDFTSEVELNHFHLLRVIGRGSFGRVRIVQHRRTGQEFALKYINKERCIRKHAVNNIVAERLLLEHIDHPHVVNLRFAFHDDQNLFMVLDLMLGGDLRFHLDHAKSSLSEMLVRFYVAEIVLALGYLHSKRIIHRDVKPDNILLDSKGHAHLSDFNVATQLSIEKPFRYSRAGTSSYMAPEVLSHAGHTVDADWWSLGVTMYELLFQEVPFKRSTPEDMARAILKDPIAFPADADRSVSTDCLDFMTQLLQKKRESRLGYQGVEQVKAHSWFKGIDWVAIENKSAVPPFIPSSQVVNFEVVYQLEELLLDEEPLRPHAKTSAEYYTSDDVETIRARQFIDTQFTAFDYTRRDSLSVPFRELPKMNSIRLDDQWSQSRYRSLGYVPTSSNDNVMGN